ncbi:MAG: hypothetical protein ACFE9N_06185 [Promethearchaeota archaeon]
MTNLIEKSLLLGFGIFTLAIFSSIIIPFMGKIADFNQNERNELESFIIFTNEIDQGLNYVIHNQNEVYLKEIDYPSDLNTTFRDKIVKYEIFIEEQFYVEIKEYNSNFMNCYFHEIPPGMYLLNISSYFSFIKVNITNLN